MATPSATEKSKFCHSSVSGALARNGLMPARRYSTDEAAALRAVCCRAEPWQRARTGIRRSRRSSARSSRRCSWPSCAARSPGPRSAARGTGARWPASTPTRCSSLDDLRSLPMLTREDWMDSQFEHPPYGELPTISGAGAIRVHTTSGTTGKGPLRALDSRKDWAWIAEMWAYGIWGCGVRPGDTAYIAFGYGSFIGFWGLHYSMEKIGVLNVPGGAQTTEARVRQIVDFGATVVASTPTYALRLAQEAHTLGHRPARLGGEPPHPVRRAGRLDPADQGADRGAVGRQGLRHRRHDRDRDDHGVRVRPPARRHPHHRGPRDRGGHRPGHARARRATGSAASAW